MFESNTQADEDPEAGQPEVSEMSKVMAILLVIGLVCFPISFTVQSYLSVSNTLLLFIFCFYMVPVYMLAAAQLFVVIIGDETRHMKLRFYSA